MAEFEYRPQGWPHTHRFCVARRFIANDETLPILFALGRHVYRVWMTSINLTPACISDFYDDRAGMEPCIGEPRENYALRNTPTPGNALYLEIARLAYNLVTAFQRNCHQASWQSPTLSKLRFKVFFIPGELTRPRDRPVLRLRQASILHAFADDILAEACRPK